MRADPIEPRWLGMLGRGTLAEGDAIPSGDGPAIARVTSARLASEAGALRHAGLTHVLCELHGPNADAHAVVTRSLFDGAAPESFDATLAAIGHARAHDLSVIVASDASRSGARVLRELGALLARLRATTWCIHGPWTPPELEPPQLPRAALTLPFVLDAAVRAQREGIDVALLGMPLCMLGPHHALALSAGGATGAPCDGCAARAACSGLGSRYRAIYGAGELRALAAPVATKSSALAALVQRALVS